MDSIKLARVHSKNKAQIKKAKTQIKLALNRAIKEKNELLVYVNIRLYIQLSVTWLEATLSFILSYYDSNIGEKDNKAINDSTRQEEKWKLLIELSFRRHYLKGSKSKALDILNLGHSAYYKYEHLSQMLETEIKTFIGIRNKLAHGQWAIALNNEGTEKQQKTTTAIWTLTKKETILINKHIQCFTILIENLVASKNKFEEDYDKNINKLEATKHEMATKYNWVLKEMHARYNKYNRTPTKK